MINSQIGVLSSRKKEQSEIVSSTFNFSSTGKPGVGGDSGTTTTAIYACDYDFPNSDILAYTDATKLSSVNNNMIGDIISPNQNCYLTDITFMIKTVGNPTTGYVYISVSEIEGTVGNGTSVPSGVINEFDKSLNYFNFIYDGVSSSSIALSTIVSLTSNPYPSPVVFRTINFPVPLEVGKYYGIAISFAGGDADNYLSIYHYDYLNYTTNSVLDGYTIVNDRNLCYTTCGYIDSFATIKNDFSNSNDFVILGSSVKKYGVVVTGNGGTIKSFDIVVSKTSGTGAVNTANLKCEVFLLSGGFPTGSSLMTFNLISLPSLADDTITFLRFTPATTGITLTSGTNYGFVISTTATNPATEVYVAMRISNFGVSSYANNTFYQNNGSTTWVNVASTIDLVFMVETTIPLVEAAFETYDATANGDQYNYIAATQNTKIAQSFTGIAGLFSKFSLNLRATGSPTGNITASLFADDGGGFGTSGKPTGTALATSAAISAATISATETTYSFTFSGANLYTMTAGTIYWIAIEYSSGSSSNKIGVVLDISSGTAPGRAAYYNGTTWAFTTYDSVGTSGASDDLCYVLYALT